MFTFQHSQLTDLLEIIQIYESAAHYQKAKGYNVWPIVDEQVVLNEIAEQRLIKITKNNIIVCIFTIAFSDPIIWGEKDNGTSLYLHRIATHSNFKGNDLMRYIVDWSKNFAKAHQKTLLRLDTWADNENLKNFYLKYGFVIVGNQFLPPSELPKHYWNITVTLFELSDIRNQVETSHL